MDSDRSNRSHLPVGREGLELWAGIALVAAGFVAVAIGWTKAADTPDVRVQIQALISGGIGGLAAVVAGGFLVQAYLTDTGFRRLERQLDRVTGALLELAGAPAPAPVPVDERATWGAPPVSGDDDTVVLSGRVVASHAAYHVPGCDLLEGRDDVRAMNVDQAQREALAPCRVCMGERVS